MLRSEFIAVLACEETTLAELPLVLLSPLAEDTLFRAFPEPPLPVTTSLEAYESTCLVLGENRRTLRGVVATSRP